MPERNEPLDPDEPDRTEAEPQGPGADSDGWGGRSPDEFLTPASARRGMGRAVEHETLRLSELLREDLVRLPLDSADMWGAIDELVAFLVASGEIPGRLARGAVRSVREREAIRPTGWKNGLALPNGRVAGLRKITVALGVSPAGIDFGCRDGLPARIIVLMFLPVGGYSRFAPGLADVARTFDDALLRETILLAREPGEVVEAIEEAEAWDCG